MTGRKKVVAWSAAPRASSMELVCSYAKVTVAICSSGKPESASSRATFSLRKMACAGTDGHGVEDKGKRG